MSRRKHRSVKRRSQSGRPRLAAERIEILDDAAAIRGHPRAFTTSDPRQTYYRLAVTVLSSALADAELGGTFANLQWRSDGTFVVENDGASLPVGKHPQFAGCSGLEVLFSKLYAEKPTRSSPDALPLAVVAALSSRLRVDTSFAGGRYRTEWDDGRLSSATHRVGSVDTYITTVNFLPDARLIGNISDIDRMDIYDRIVSHAKAFARVPAVIEGDVLGSWIRTALQP